MPAYRSLVGLFLVLAILSLVVGVLAKGIGFVVLGLHPLSYLRFTGVCLLMVMAMSLAELASRSPQ